jgi:hypothetical protein
MFNSTSLEVAIGMALIYLLLSLFCTAINEAIAGLLGSRAKNLEKGIRSLFTDGLKSDGSGGAIPAVTLAEAIYDHGLVQSLYRSTPAEIAGKWSTKLGTNLPSYIPSRIFASALLDVLFPAMATPSTGNAQQRATNSPNNLPAMFSQLESLPDSKGKQAIVSLVKQAGGDITKTREAFENWYDDGMDRAAGWYKRKTQIILFVIGLCIAVGLNVDSLAIGRTLWVSPALRSYTITTAEQFAHSNSSSLPNPDPTRDLRTLQSLAALPIGWTPSHYPWMREQAGAQHPALSILRLISVIAGWFLTAIAMTLGAPFWFDTLNRFMVIRSTIKPREKS